MSCDHAGICLFFGHPILFLAVGSLASGGMFQQLVLIDTTVMHQLYDGVSGVPFAWQPSSESHDITLFICTHDHSTERRQMLRTCEEVHI
ncbi:hypothetical protein F4604DRAFT_1246444 [Suillus subluteus]|nr:hypothetical protein F4604DRAFT_1246444 [Suillus subluteus]